MSRQLPANPNLEHLKKQAKELLHDLQQGSQAAVDVFRSQAPSALSAPKLADAQHVIARDYGFMNWSNLKEHVESLALPPADQFGIAVTSSNSNRVSRLLTGHPELRAQINEPMSKAGGGMLALLSAVQRGDRKTIDVLLQAGADIHARSRSWAGSRGVLDDCAPELAPFLIERGAKVDVHSAARLGMLEKLKEIVEGDPATVHARGDNGQMPLHFASTVEIAGYLLDRGAEIDARDLQHESTPAQHMLRVVQARHYPRDRQDIARFLVLRGCQTDILMAAALGDLELVRRHLGRDPASIRMRVSEAYFPKHDPRSGGSIYIPQFGRGRTPHQIARDLGHEEVFQYLMQNSPQQVMREQAYELGDENLFRSLLANRANLIETLSEEERRCVVDAAQNNNTNAVRLMLEAGWPVDARGEYDMTPLQWASWHGNAEMVREILKHHPVLELSDNHHGITALGCALHGSMNGWHRDTGDYVATVEALLNAGAKAPKVTDKLEASEEVR